MGRQLASGESIVATDLLFYPWGKQVYLHTGGNVLDAMLAAPFRWVLGPVAGYNAWILAICVANALAMRKLARHLVRDDVAAGIAGAFFAFNPFVLHEIADGRPTQGLQAFLVLFVLDWLRAESRPGAALRAGIWLALSALTYWYFAIFAGLAAGAIALWRLRRAPRREPLTRWALATVVALGLTLPFALPMLHAGSVPGLLKVSEWTWWSWSPTTAEGMNIGVYVFDLTQRMSGFWALADDAQLVFIKEDVNLFWGQVAVLAIGVLVGGGWRWAIVPMLLVSLTIAVGPTFEGLPNVPYLTMVWTFRVMQRLWWPSRALVMAHIAIGMAFAVALAAFRAWPRIRVAAVVALAAGWIVELEGTGLRPMGSWPGAIPAGYRCLQEGGEGAVIELPYAHTQAHLYYQTAHGRPIFGGMVEDNPLLAPAEQVAYREENSFMRFLLDVSAEDRYARVYEQADREAVHALGYRYVLVDKHAYRSPMDERPRIDAVRDERLRSVRDALVDALGGPVFEDADTIIFAPWGDEAPCPEHPDARG